MLNDLGCQTSLKVLSETVFLTHIRNTNNKVQISLVGWNQDYPAANVFLIEMYSCASFRPGSDASPNIAGVCDKALDAEMNKAMLTGLTDPKAAAAQWAAIDRKVTDSAAPAAVQALAQGVARRSWMSSARPRPPSAAKTNSKSRCRTQQAVG